MIKPNYMDKLLDGVEVEWNSLGQVGEFTRGKRFVKTDMISEGFPCIHYGEMYTHYSVWAETTKSFVSHELASNLRVANHGDVIIVAAGETIEDIGKGTAWLGNTGVAIHDACFSYRSSLNPKYVSYFLRTKHFHDQIKKHISSGKISAINATGLSKAKIPIPPSNVQEEIVRILDAFTEHTAEIKAELKAELIARKKQYRYYSGKLLAFENCEVEWKTLGDVSEYSKKRVANSNLDKKNYVGVDNLLQNGAGKTDSNYVPIEGNSTGYFAQDILIGNIRPYLKKIWFADCTGGTNGDVLVIHPTCKDINPKFLYRILADNRFFDYNMQHAKGAKMPRGNKVKIMEYSIPIPYPSNPIKSLEEQNRILTILEKFDTLTSSITEDLLREIELRQKQYEYFRDMLLSFPKKEVEK